MLLIFPPVTIPSEPPVGIARLSGALTKHHIPHEIIDANVEGLQWLLNNVSTPTDVWSKRALKNLEKNIEAIKDGSAFSDIRKYNNIILELNHLLTISGREKKEDVKVTLSDYLDNNLSPLRSKDLIASAKGFQKNPFFDFFSKRIGDVLNFRKIDVVGISINYLSQALCAFAIIGFLKQNYNVKVIVGGSLINSWYKRGLIEEKFRGLIDRFVYGQGERHLLNFFDVSPKYFDSIPPDYEKFKKELYFSPGFILPYNTSMGCYWNKCTFCPEKAEGNDYIQINPLIAVKEIKELSKRTNPILVHITDNAIHPDVLETFINNPFNIQWYGFVRLNKALEDINYCERLRASGCVMLKIGIESADQRVLNSMKKGINIENAKKILSNLKSAGIGTYIYILFGTPFETEESLNKTMDFVVENYKLIDFINIAIFNLPVCSPDTKDLKLKNFYEGDLSLYTDFIHPHGLNRKYIRNFIDKTFKRQPFIKKIMERHPRCFTSNHAPFFVEGSLKVS